MQDKKTLYVIALFLLIGTLYFVLSNKDEEKMNNEEINKETKNIEVSDNPETIKVENNSQKETPQIEKISTSTKQIKNIKNMKTATLKTNMGEIEIELYIDKTPNTVENFKNLVNANFYNGIKFHRIIKDFMIQSGDPLTKDDSKKDYWGTGGPGYKFEDEIKNDNKNDAGTLSMANSGPNTNGSQFFINTKDNNFLDYFELR